MKDWEDIIKERQLGRKAELPESDWNEFLSRKAEHDRVAKRNRRLIAFSISVPAAAAVLLLLFLIPFNSVAPDDRTAQNEPSGSQVITDSIDNHVDSITIDEKPKVEIAQVNPEVEPDLRTGVVFGGTDGFGGSTSLPRELAVNAVVAKVQMVNDTVKFNSAAYRLPEGASVEDLIRKLPGVEVDSAGNVTVNGKAISRILVNGKEFFNNDKTKSLTELTAEMIEKVKAYDKQQEQMVAGNTADSTWAVTYPLIVYDGNVVDVDEDKLASFDFERSYYDRDSLSCLLGVKRGKLRAVKMTRGQEALKEWGPDGLNGVLEVFSGTYYRKSMRAGKLDGGPYETVTSSRRLTWTPEK